MNQSQAFFSYVNGVVVVSTGFAIATLPLLTIFLVSNQFSLEKNLIKVVERMD